MISALLTLSQLNTISDGFLKDSAIVGMFLLGILVAGVTVYNGVRLRPPHETPTRREFDELKGKVSRLDAMLPTMKDEILRSIEATRDALSEEIAELGGHEEEGRKEIWEVVNTQRERVSALEAKSGKA